MNRFAVFTQPRPTPGIRRRHRLRLDFAANGRWVRGF